MERFKPIIGTLFISALVAVIIVNIQLAKPQADADSNIDLLTIMSSALDDAIGVEGDPGPLGSVSDCYGIPKEDRGYWSRRTMLRPREVYEKNLDFGWATRVVIKASPIGSTLYAIYRGNLQGFYYECTKKRRSYCCIYDQGFESLHGAGGEVN